MRGVALIALPVMLGSQTMSDVVGKGYHWMGRERTAIEGHKADVPSGIAFFEPVLAVSEYSFGIILADPADVGHPLVKQTAVRLVLF